MKFVVNNPNPVDKDIYMCQICGKSFSRAVHVRDHVENVHFPNNFQYTCEVCDQVLKSKIALKNHQIRHKSGY